MSTAELWKNRREIHLRARREGEAIFLEIQEKLKDLKPGTLVAINVTNREYIVGESEHELIAIFRERFGPNDIGWVRKIGDGT